MIIRGTETLTFVGYSRRYNRQTGHQVGYQYEGTTDAVEAVYLTNASGADDVDLTPDGPTARISFWYGGTSSESTDQQEVTDTWELVSNLETKSIYQHVKTLALTTKEIAAVKNGVEALLEDPTAELTLPNAMQNIILDHATAGHDGFQIPQYVLRRTRTVGARYSNNLLFADTFKLHTTAQVKAAESIPTGIQFDMDAIDANLPTLGTGGGLADLFGYRWLKYPPSKVQTGWDKFNLTYEYWHAAWSTWIYDEKA